MVTMEISRQIEVDQTTALLHQDIINSKSHPLGKYIVLNDFFPSITDYWFDFLYPLTVAIWDNLGLVLITETANDT